MLPYLFPPNCTSPVLVTICLGANDSSVGCQHVPLEEFEENLTKILNFFRSDVFSTKPQIILISPPPTSRSGERQNERTKEYARRVVHIAKIENIEYLDLWAAMVAKDNWQSFLSDGLHLSASGNQFFWQQLRPVLERLLGERKYDFPPWSSMLEDPEGTLKKFLTDLS
eukprot:TRINITY_DN3922_c0_g1_i3.p2 TRINITY_DN3922_c0_g1~~TRINITY_DN3922_c0_g1_i3.p2  ORF type:complete len:169 (+),score=35.02 TRINITY_DN3922_c0_g1_i3:304-810(+)